jgi:hypothetical protein
MTMNKEFKMKKLVTLLALVTLLNSCGQAPENEANNDVKSEDVQLELFKRIEINNIQTGFVEHDNGGSLSYSPFIIFSCKNISPKILENDIEVKIEILDARNGVIAVNAVTVHDSAMAPMLPLEIITKNVTANYLKIPDYKSIPDKHFTAKMSINNVEFRRYNIDGKIVR